MALPKVYIETSVVSYLTAFPSRDIVVTAHQQITQAWWAVGDSFDRYVSEAVLTEAAAGDPGAAARRITAISALPVLKITNYVAALARYFVAEGASVPERCEPLATATSPRAIRRPGVERMEVGG